MFRRRRIDAHAADRIDRLGRPGLIPVNAPAPPGMRMIVRPMMRMGVIVLVMVVSMTARAAAAAALAFVPLSG
jgi:hypothetical protein